MKTIDADALVEKAKAEASGMASDELREHFATLVEWLVDKTPTIKPMITLNDLLDLIDYNRESETEKIQIVGPDDDWNEYDEIRTSSTILFHLGSAKVSEIEAVGNDVIRVGIDWSTAPCKENQP